MTWDSNELKKKNSKQTSKNNEIKVLWTIDGDQTLHFFGHLGAFTGPQEVKWWYSNFEDVNAHIGVELCILSDVTLLGHQPAEE